MNRNYPTLCVVFYGMNLSEEGHRAICIYSLFFVAVLNPLWKRVMARGSKLLTEIASHTNSLDDDKLSPPLFGLYHKYRRVQRSPLHPIQWQIHIAITFFSQLGEESKMHQAPTQNNFLSNHEDYE